MEKQGRILLNLQRFVQLLLASVWLILLRDTDSYWSAYVLCAGISMVCLWDNCRNGKTVTGRMAVCLLCCSGVFSAMVLLANYKLILILPGLQKLCIAAGIAIGGTAVAWQILLWAVRLPVSSLPVDGSASGRLFLLCFAGISGWFLLYLFGAAYPGYYTPDSFNSLMQIQSGEYVNNHPFWYTMLIKLLTGIGKMLFEDTNAAMSVYSVGQILILAACMAYAVMTLYQNGCPWYFLAGVLLCYTFLPYNLAFSVTMWKDIPFSASILLMLTALYRFMKDIGARKRNVAFFSAGAVGLCLMRTNGLALFSVTALVLLFVLKNEKRKLLILIAVLLVFCWCLTNPVLAALHVGETDFVEILAVPFQQIARVITNGYELSPADYEMLNAVFDVEQIPELYTHESVDPIKQIALRQDQRGYLKEHLAEYGRLWLRLGAQHPGEYLKAWIELTKGYWNGGYEYWIYYIGGMNEELGITRMEQTSVISSVFERYFTEFENAVLFQPLVSIGLHVWALIGCCVVNCLKKREEFLLTIPLLVLVAGLWLGTPVYSEFRYAYPVFLSMPLILGVTLFAGNASETA